jgi:tRNA A37 threonylcarbamoyladenosine biosynthesis protein TsaE
LENIKQILAAGLEEYLHPAGVTVIEWAERWFPSLESRRELSAWIQMEPLGPSDRRITYDDPGA